MNTGLAAWGANSTWEIASLASRRKPIRCKCLYKTKFKSDDFIERYKATLVVLGCKQQYGIDY